MLHIQSVSSYVPNHFVDVEQAGALLNLDKAKIKVFKKIYGLEKIPAAMGIKMDDFVQKPVEQLLQQSQVAKEDIKYLIHCHTAKVIAPFGHSIVRTIKQRLGLTNAVAFGASLNNCASTIASLDMLLQVLPDDPNAKAIIVCGDYAFTSVLQLIPNTSILGDAAAAILVGRQGDRNRLLSLAMQTDGQYARGVWLLPDESKTFEMSYPRLLAGVIESALQKANLQKEQIKLIVPHNVNIPSWHRVAVQLGFPLQKIYLQNVRKYSHCFGADIFINLASILAEQQLAIGDYYVMATVGLGATFAAAVFQY